MNRLARYHIIWAHALAVITGVVAGCAIAQWLNEGHPPITRFWAVQMIVVAGAYRFWYHIQAFRKANKQ